MQFGIGSKHVWLCASVTIAILCALPEARADFMAGAIAYQKKDFSTAFREFNALAAKGNAGAETMLGQMYVRGEGVPQDPKSAATWYEKASRHGSAGAQYALGNMYYLGNSVPKDAAHAAQLFEKAANQGLLDAMYLVGILYSRGEGVQMNKVQAHKWLNLAASYGVNPFTSETVNAAKDARVALESEMSQTEIREAQALATKWDAERKAKNLAIERQIENEVARGRAAQSRK